MSIRQWAISSTCWQKLVGISLLKSTTHIFSTSQSFCCTIEITGKIKQLYLSIYGNNSMELLFDRCFMYYLMIVLSSLMALQRPCQGKCREISRIRSDTESLKHFFISLAVSTQVTSASLILFSLAVRLGSPCNFTKKWILHLPLLHIMMDMFLNSKDLLLKLAFPKK